MPMPMLKLVPCVPPPRGPAQRACRAGEVLLPSIARRLGWADRPRRFIIGQVRLLAAKHGFPLPKNPRFVRGVRQVGPLAIDARSVWDADLVDAWFDDDRPPAEAAAAALARQSAARAELARRAMALVA